MRLDRLDLTRYGRFTESSLSFAAPAVGGSDLHIVYGPNEAGKSTLFSAWLDLLFGVPTRSRYDFLHPGPRMQVGALLSHAGGTLEIKRLKRNAASLFDRYDAAIPEAVLQSALGGLSREGYSAMFSLDDETIEKGGEGILASHGDLGEMLFSASAGLSGLAPRLETIRAELDGFHRTGKRSGWLYDAKKQISELDRQRREIEVSSGAMQKLTREAASAEHEWRDARAREDAGQTALERLQDLAGTLPLLARRAQLEERLAARHDLPDADPLATEQIARIDQDRLTLSSKISDRALRLQALAEKLGALATDPAVLAQSDAIAAAEASRPEHDTAIKDLPRRDSEAGVARSRIATLIADLGTPDLALADLILPGPQIAQMREFLTARSGLLAAVAAAGAETRKASDLLTREAERLGDPGPAEDAPALAALLSRLRAQDPAEARARALHDRDLAQGRLAAAIAALAPWTGDGDMLAALAPPPGWQIAAWETGLESARQKEVDARRAASDLREQLLRMQSDDATRATAQSATGITLPQAAQARRAREALWSAHLAALDLGSAHAFEQALREDDRISALLAEAMAEARRDVLHHAAQDVLSARLQSAQSALDAAQTAQTALKTAIEAACAPLGLQGASLADLKRWLDLRLGAMSEHRAVHEAQADVARGDDAVNNAAAALCVALGLNRADGHSFEYLLADATARLDAADRRRDARRHLTALGADLRDREAAENAAGEALADWRQGWDAARAGSLLCHLRDDAPNLGTVLDLLAQLGDEARALALLDDRIAKMKANRDQFTTAKAAILGALDLAPATPWADLVIRLRRAEDTARDHHSLTRQTETEMQQDREDRRALAAREAEAAALGATLDWSEASGISLSDHIAQCREAAGLRHDIAALHLDLRGRPTPEEGATPELIRAQLESQRTDLQLLRRETEMRLAAHLEATRKIDTIGADDALARLGGERANLLLDAGERAKAHLAARFGLLAFEAGLRRYRDEHRSAMLAQASDAFSRLSRGAYSGLAAQPDGAQEVLVALPANGGAKLAADLSKGTRFQLYLALRIAGYHELAQSRPTVPFIADDIMETFDDGRSGAAFSLLADMSRVGQVIYLTHHRHLCDIARDACPDVNIIDLQSI